VLGRRALAAASAALPLAVAAVFSSAAGAGAATVSPAVLAAPAVSFVHAQLGKPYRWGGTGPNSYDCSGLVYAAYRSAGLILPRVAQDQYDQLPHVPLSALQPGDLLFFGVVITVKPRPKPSASSSRPTPSASPTTSPSPKATPSATTSPSPKPSPRPPVTRLTIVGHVGMYIGQHEMIDAPYTGAVVRIVRFDWPDLLPVAARPIALLTLPVRAGSTGYPVVQAQRLLGVTADGAFGPVTEHATRTFQAAHQLPVTGAIDLPTWSALVTRAFPPAPPPAPIAKPRPAPKPPLKKPSSAATLVAPYRRLILTEGSTGKAVAVVQRLVHITADGDFGPHTEVAVRAFQKAHGIRSTGNVGPLTWAALARL
jgi:cell wall-associated NlpC family hydrolase/peptidoglycan hydrolase-like protein with peptidoglycan-binding domain